MSHSSIEVLVFRLKIQAQYSQCLYISQEKSLKEERNVQINETKNGKKLSRFFSRVRSIQTATDVFKSPYMCYNPRSSGPSQGLECVGSY